MVLDDSEILPFRVSWTPSEGQDPILDAFAKTVKLEPLLTEFNLSKNYSLSKGQKRSVITHMCSVKKLTNHQL